MGRPSATNINDGIGAGEVRVRVPRLSASAIAMAVRQGPNVQAEPPGRVRALSPMILAAVLIVALTGCTGQQREVEPAATAARPPSALPSTDATGIPLEPALAVRARRDLGSQLDYGVLVAAPAGDELILVVGRAANDGERVHGGRAAAVWIAHGDGPFQRAVDYLSYDFTCRVDDPVCPDVRPGGLGFLALRAQPGGRTYVMIGATRDRSVEVMTAEGNTYEVGAVPHGGIVEVTTSRPYETRTRVTMADGRSYELMVPPHGVVT